MMTPAGMFCSTSQGSISIPMETKKMAMNISLMGMVLGTIARFWAVDWEMMMPMTKAPMATLRPMLEESKAIPKQRPSETSIRTSLE